MRKTGNDRKVVHTTEFLKHNDQSGKYGRLWNKSLFTLQAFLEPYIMDYHNKSM